METGRLDIQYHPLGYKLSLRPDSKRGGDRGKEASKQGRKVEIDEEKEGGRDGGKEGKRRPKGHRSEVVFYK